MNQYSVNELKLVYRILHKNLATHIELMDADFLSDLQSLLQKKAVADGIDVGDHGAWDAWLGNNVVACQIRNENRTLLN
jgi:hypothetical protein